MDSRSIRLLGAPSASSSTNSWAYDVFLSFRGEDTRYNFTDHLHGTLVQKGIRTFIDDELPRGEEISQGLLDTIEESRCSVIIFSKDYASSKWCLDELAHIMECRKSKNQMVWPVFYKVDPSDVRNQSGSYGEALSKHENKFKEEAFTNHDECKLEGGMRKLLRWKESLEKAANLSGWHYFERRETEFIQKIVEEISEQVLNYTHISVAKYQVGIESRVQDVYKLLEVGGNDVLMVGIWGNGGIGKTTVAKAVYNSMAHMFEGSCFLENVRERSIPYDGLVELQNLLLKEILRGNEFKVTYADRGINVIKERLSRKKVLLIVDDVNHLDQLNNLVGGCDWFGQGSRIIITTRDRQLLTSHEVQKIYKAKKLNYQESRDLFISWNALPRNISLDDDYVKLANTVVDYTQGLPLALKVLGSHLCGRSMDAWRAALDGVPHPDIQKILKLSYDALEDSVKEVFLDIACFFKGKHMKHVIPILEGCDLNPKYAMEVLVEKALLDIEQNEIWMHDLLEELGRAIVHQESPHEPGERSRLWFHEDVYHVLTESTGTNKVKGIMVKFPKPDELCLSDDSFSQMKNLRLFINVNAQFFGDHVDYLSNQLRFLHWPECPLEALPSSFNPRKLVELYMPRSRLLELGEGLKRMQNLKSMNFESCEFLESTPNISGIPNLEYLNLDDCTSLVEVHPSVGFHDKLVELSLTRCHNLRLLPRLNSNSLYYLNLEDCRSLDTFPEIGEKMQSLRAMFLSGSGIKELPSSIRYLIRLECLDLERCENLTSLPSSIYELQHLNFIIVGGCRKLVTFPHNVEAEVSVRAESLPLLLPALGGLTIEKSNLSEINFVKTLDCVSTFISLDLLGNEFLVSIPVLSKFVNLRKLHLRGCKRLREIPELPPKIVLVEASGCLSLQRFSSLSDNLKQKKVSQMIELVDLSDCWRLCDNLARELTKMNNILRNEQVIALFFDRFLSSQQHGFRVLFPASFEAPSKLFSCKDLTDLDEACEFLIEIPQDFKCQNQGLALYAAVDNPRNKRRPYGFQVKIYVNQQGEKAHFVRFDDDFRRIESGHLWLCYIRFQEMFYRDDQIIRPQSPFTCRVNFQNLIQDSLRFKSCGVHLVMPQEDEDVSTSVDAAGR